MKNRPPLLPVRPSVVRSSARNFLTLVALLLASFAAQAAGAGVVTHLSGTLLVKQADGSTKVLSVKSEVQEGETITTQDKTYARIKFQDGGEAVLRPNSQLVVSNYTYTPEKPGSDNLAVGLLKGGMRMVTGLLGKRNPDKVNVVTPTATIGIRGTHFGLLMCQGDCVDIPSVTGQPPADGLHIDVAEGAIAVTNPAGQQLLAAGQFGFVQSLATPPTIVPPSQGIRVTMPHSISQNNAAGRSVGQNSGSSECAVQ